MQRDYRLSIFNDLYSEDTFIFKNKDFTFARLNKINDSWCAWFYLYHIQRDYDTLKEAINAINTRFIRYYKGL